MYRYPKNMTIGSPEYDEVINSHMDVYKDSVILLD